MDEFENPAKNILVSGSTICYNRCAAVRKNNDYLNSYERNCVGKCMDKYFENHTNFRVMLGVAMPDKKALK